MTYPGGPFERRSPRKRGPYSTPNHTFHDDQSRIRTAYAPENMLTVRHIAVNVAARKKGKDSMRLALKTAGWDDDYLVRLVAP